ncbi:hypothetical protein AFLA_008776 [Aspergillus flavus NRRL3357]|nr:hypothetical protein AFLA_008776 [Aspergillus flavus NRRL3357]
MLYSFLPSPLAYHLQSTGTYPISKSTENTHVPTVQSPSEKPPQITTSTVYVYTGPLAIQQTPTTLAKPPTSYPNPHHSPTSTQPQTQQHLEPTLQQISASVEYKISLCAMECGLGDLRHAPFAFGLGRRLEGGVGVSWVLGGGF